MLAVPRVASASCAWSGPALAAIEHTAAEHAVIVTASHRNNLIALPLSSVRVDHSTWNTIFIPASRCSAMWQ
jgi:hypothetical protein